MLKSNEIQLNYKNPISTRWTLASNQCECWNLYLTILECELEPIPNKMIKYGKGYRVVAIKSPSLNHHTQNSKESSLMSVKLSP